MDHPTGIADWIRTRIKDGRYPPGGLIPTAEKLARMHRTTAYEALKAFRALAKEGLVVTLPGSGTRVLAPDGETGPVTKVHWTARTMRQLLADGAWPAGQPVPRLVDLARQFSVSYGTARSALRVLVEEGILVRRSDGVVCAPTAGTNGLPSTPAEKCAATIRERIRSGGYQPGSRLPTNEELTASYGAPEHVVRAAVTALISEGLVFTRGVVRYVLDPDKPDPIPPSKITVIAAAMREAIADGTYPPGSLLPGQTQLARIYGVSQATMAGVQQLLSAEGLTEARRRSGTRVLGDGKGASPRP